MVRDLTYEDYAKKLHKDYKTAYDDIKAYLEIMRFSDEDISGTMGDVVELLLAAQTEGIPVKSVVGEDMAAFCRQLGQALKPSRKRIVWSWLMSFAIAGVLVSVCMAVVAVVLLITREGSLTEPVSAGMWFAYWLLVGGMDGLHDKLSWFWWSHKKEREAGLASLRGSVSVWGWCLINVALIVTRNSKETDFLLLPLWIPLLIIAVFSASVLIMNRRKKRRAIKKKYPSLGKVDQEKLSWNEEIEELRNAVADRNSVQGDMTREERQKYVRTKLRWDALKYLLLNIIPLSIYAPVLWASPLMLHDGEITLTSFVVGIMFWSITLLGWTGLNIWIAVKQFQFNKKYLATGKDILDNTLLYNVFGEAGCIKREDSR